MLWRPVVKNLFKGTNLFLQRKNSSKCMTVKEVYDLADLPTQSVCIKGWIKSVRNLKNVIFLNIDDGTNFKQLQVVMPLSLHTSNANFGSAVEVQGVLEKSKHADQKVELKATKLDVVGGCDVDVFPIKVKQKQSLEYIRTYPHLKFKTRTHSSLLRINDVAHFSAHEFFRNNNFVHVHVPILTTNDCEGAGEVFQVMLPGNANKSNPPQNGMFFDVPTFLTVSGQFHLEAVAGNFSKVYTFGPTCRADPSHTRHHLAEFHMIEAEMSFINSLDNIKECIENLLKKMASDVFENCKEDVDFVWKNVAQQNHKDRIETIMSKKFQCITYTEAIDMLMKANLPFEKKVFWGVDLSKEHERYLVSAFNSTPVFITDYPATFTPFYAKVNEDGKTVAMVDLLFPEVGEVCGGSLREHRLDVLTEKIKGLKSQSLEWYLDLRRFGTTMHGGFGVGYERFLQVLLGFENIKDVIPFPRTAGSCKL